jgi:DNA modification methylase
MRIEKHNIQEMVTFPCNPRKKIREDPAFYARLRKSVETFGYVEPIVWNERTRHVIGGNQRLEILKDLGMSEIEVVVVDLDESKEKALNVALNKIVGAWDEAMLQDLIASLDADVRRLTGFSNDEIFKLLRKLRQREKDPDDIPDVPEAVTKPGDLVVLGEHRLLCGDSTKREDVARLMNGKRAIVFATDPPYLVDYDGSNHPHAFDKSLNNKDWSRTYGATWDESGGNIDLYDKFVDVAIKEAIEPNAAWYCWHAFKRQAMVESVWNKHGAIVHQQIIWAKDRAIISHSWYMWRHEPCFFGWVEGKKPPRKSDDFPNTVWDLPTIKPGMETEHPTSKPVRIFEIPMEQHTEEGQICYEPFAGSGSQIIAAERLDRRCYAMEISPIYCDVIVRRWENFTSEEAVRA